jgi:hypothetical protein
VKKKNETEEEFVEEEDEDEDELPEKCAREDPTPRLQEKQLDGPSSRSQQTKSLNSQELVKNDQKFIFILIFFLYKFFLCFIFFLHRI